MNHTRRHDRTSGPYHVSRTGEEKQRVHTSILSSNNHNNPITGVWFLARTNPHHKTQRVLPSSGQERQRSQRVGTKARHGLGGVQQFNRKLPLSAQSRGEGQATPWSGKDPLKSSEKA